MVKCMAPQYYPAVVEVILLPHQTMVLIVQALEDIVEFSLRQH